jgi:phosphate transport system substrate-binding protein
VKLKRTTSLAGVALISVLALAACGSNSNGSSASASGGSGAAASCAKGTIKASGSTAQQNAMAAWITGYQTQCSGATIDYQASGSGAGVTDFTAGTTAFAGSDAALKDPDEQAAADKRCATGTAIDIPMVGGAIAIGYNVAGVSKLTLTPKILAGIFSSKITTWNDPAITAANPGVTLPSAKILQFHRSDASGTTANFTGYLAANDPTDWTYAVGKPWVAPGGQGATGSDQVASSVKSTANSIGYFELSFAQGISTAQIDNGGGAVAASSATAAKTIAGSTIGGSGDNIKLTLALTTKDPGSYPIVLVTYEIVCQKGLAADQSALVKSFLTYTASDTVQGALSATGYVPITGDLLTKVRASVASIS